MKIDNNNNNINPLSTQKTDALYQAEKEKASRLQESNALGTGKDRVEFSDRGRLLAKARASLDEVPETDMDRINQLRQQIENGTYEIPHEKLAETLLSRLKLT
ncbi:MAG: flagellar biosynthesis anti-sigma factor FlgM [Chloroflexi bacterium]|jgi:flagellar biosynthesis anti-sigma factor FlgM|nr:flagellar biosynthesis anti-sigma factor FlgM [Anaerolineaceae bacterium]NMB87699.1 flagellar biosynthesis anti-sigma factor FlgM [Chloroflexota bacterium]